MSTMSKADYLKRYLSGPAADPKPKKRRKKVSGVKVKKVANMKIHDDDANDWARRPTAAEREDEQSDDGIVDGAKVLKDQYGDSATVFNPDEIIRDQDEPEFRGKNTFKSVVESHTQRHDSDNDATPPRGGRHDSDDDDAAPPRGGRHDSDDDDAAPPRRRQRHDSDDDDDDTDPPRRRQRHDSDDDDDDAAPPRRHRHDSDDDDDDAAPPRRLRHDSDDNDDDDAAPPRRRRHDSDDDDASPPRRSAVADSDGDGDASPPRRSHRDRDASPARPRNPKNDSTRDRVQAAVVTGGLVDASALKAANVLKKKKIQEEFARMADSGQSAETVHRDKATGKRLDPKLERLKKRQEEMKKREAEEAKMKWGGPGIANSLAKEDQMLEDLKTMAAPFARGRDDEDMNSMLKEQIHADDPMAEYMMKKREKTTAKSGARARPKYKGPWPANRYNIPPGHMWDGVDRSNGFEKKMFNVRNRAAATANDAYKWSTENM